MVQFAGFTDLSQRFNDTQVFDLDSLAWEEVGPRRDSARPVMRCLLTAALDPGARTMIIHGGQRTGPLDDTWAFDLGTREWMNLTPEVRPSGRMLPSSFVDRERRFLVFGGATDAGRVNETWAFDLALREWTRLQIPDPPPPREAAMSALVEDEEHSSRLRRPGRREAQRPVGAPPRCGGGYRELSQLLQLLQDRFGHGALTIVL